MSYFSIAAPQTVVLPDGTQLHFRINPADSSQVEMHLTGERDGETGTWVIPMRRNGGAAGIPEFSGTAQPQSDVPPNQARIDAMDDSHPVKAELKRRQDAADKGQQLDADGQVIETHPLAGYKSVNDDAVREPLVAEGGQIKPALPPDRTVTSTSLKDNAQPRNDLKPETA